MHPPHLRASWMCDNLIEAYEMDSCNWYSFALYMQHFGWSLSNGNAFFSLCYCIFILYHFCFVLGSGLHTIYASLLNCYFLGKGWGILYELHRNIQSNGFPKLSVPSVLYTMSNISRYDDGVKRFIHQHLNHFVIYLSYSVKGFAVGNIWNQTSLL